MRNFPVLLLSLFIAVSCSENIGKISDKVFSLAVDQYKLMDGRLAENEFPKTLDTTDGEPMNCGSVWWTSGFFPGCLWLVYEYSGDEDIKALAERNTMKLRGICNCKTSHDIGFQTMCSFGNAWRITADSLYLPVLEDAAAKLSSRFSEVTGTIRSWDFSAKGKDWQWPVIIDNMMNLELLMEASRLFDCDSLSLIAMSHADATIANHFRPDYTCCHVVDYDPLDGHVRSKCTHQGYSDDSSWARGQAWALYGFTMMYRQTGVTSYLKQAEKIAAMLSGRLPSDGVPYWDFDSPDIPDTFKDASAAAVMASAFVELSTLTKDKNLSSLCIGTAERQIRTLASKEYLARRGENGNFLLKHSVGSLPGNSEVNVPLIYADYYFLEALIRYKNKDERKHID